MKYRPKIYFLSSILYAACSPVFAGMLGEATAPIILKPFVSLEGSGWPTENQISISRVHNSFVRHLVIPANIEPWGGRIGAGLLLQRSERLNLIGETGWNYFGSATYNSNVDGNAISNKVSISGADLLIGATYRYTNKFSLLLEVGTLIQRIIGSTQINNFQGTITAETLGTPTDLILNGDLDFGANITDVQPEIKVGGIYNYTENLGVSLAYMHSFGGTPRVKGSFTSWTNNNNAYLYANVRLRNPSLNIVTLGLRYQFT